MKKSLYQHTIRIYITHWLSYFSIYCYLSRLRSISSPIERSRDLLIHNCLNWLLIILLLLVSYPSNAKNINVTYIKIDSLNNLSEQYRYSDYEKSLALAEEALILSKQIEDTDRQAESLHNIGSISYIMADYNKAYDYYKQCLKLYEELNDVAGIAKSINNIGVVELAKDDLSGAFISFKKALNLFIQLENKNGQASCLNNIGLIEQKENNYYEALNYFQKALAIKINLDDVYSLKQTIFNIGTSYYYTSHFDSSMYYLQKCYDYENELNDAQGMAITLNSIGLVYMLMGNFKEADDHFNKSMELANEIGDKESVIQNLNTIGILHLINRNNNTAYMYFDSCRNIALESNMTDKIMEIYKNLANVLEKQEKYREALESYQFYTVMANQFIEEQKRVINIENEYKVFEIEKEKEKEKHKKRIISIILSAIILVLFITAIYVIKHKQLKHKSLLEKTVANQEKLRYRAVIEASEQERKRIAGDLHDSISYMLSTAKLNMSGFEDSINKHAEINQAMLNNAIELIDNACTEVRSISHRLMPGSLTKLGIIPAIKDLVRNINQSGQLLVEFTYDGVDARLDEKIEISLYRIIQELLNNIIKHAEASKSRISIQRNGSVLSIEINDNGIGLNPDKLKNSAGIGWKNIYSRVGIINGKIDVISIPGRNTNVIIQVPL